MARRGGAPAVAVAVAAAVAVMGLLAAGCSGGGHRARGSGGTTPGDALTFRAVLASMPYGSRHPGGGAPFACDAGGRVTPAAKQAPAARIVLADRTRHQCYELGPTLLTGHDVDRAEVVFLNGWAVTVRFRTDAFVRDVAAAEVDRDVAIVLDGVVLSTPRINPGITGRSITIAVGLDEATARRIAGALDPR